MEERKRCNIRKNVKGITLIALVVTIIVLLILATVAISLSVGSNGIFTRAKDAVDKYEDASIEELMEMYKTEVLLGNEKTIKERLIEDKKVTEADLDDNKGILNLTNKVLVVWNFNGLKEISKEVENGETFEGKKIYLINNIDCGAEFNIESGELTAGENFVPIGSSNSKFEDEGLEGSIKKEFKGTFEGCSYEISKIYIKKNNQTDYCTALFGYIGENGIIRDLKIKDSYIHGYFETAAIAGRNRGIITNCINESTVVGDYYLTAGIVGRNINTIESCQNYGDIIGGQAQTSGIAANCDYGNNIIINNCQNYGRINANEGEIGGIVGGIYCHEDSNRVKITNCINEGILGDIQNEKIKAVGGIAGRAYGRIRGEYKLGVQIQNCSNKGSLSGYEEIGGIAGYMTDTTVESCWNSGEINGSNKEIGGIVGQTGNNAIISKCYNLGKVFLKEGGYYGAGGIVGNLYSTEMASKVEECYNKGEVYSLADSETGKQTGGIVGSAGVIKDEPTGTIKNEVINCYNTGYIHGIGRIGGILGFSIRTIVQNCYNVGKLENELSSSKSGGIIDLLEETPENSNNYWLDTCGSSFGISSLSSNEEAEPKNDSEMKNLSGTLSDVFVKDSRGINNGYPIFNWQH